MSYGYQYERILADGRVVGVHPLTYGRGRVIIGDRYGIHQGY